MVISLINDCSDANAFGRITARVGSLFPGSTINKVALHNYSDLEAAGNLIDIIDGYGEEEGVIIVNAAPRHGSAKKWDNGTPFGWFKYKKLLIVTTVDGLTLSLAKQFGLIEKYYVTDIPTVMKFVVKEGLLPEDMIDYISRTQFRSFDYEPRLAKWIYDGIAIPATEHNLDEIPATGGKVWLIDNFGNAKTTLVPSELKLEAGKTYKTSLGDIPYYDRLKDVPDGELAIIQGSSGLGDKRFLEVTIQGKDVGVAFNLKVGSEIEILK